MSTENLASAETAEENVLFREYKDSAFRIVFGKPEKMVELYNAMFDTDYPPDTKVDVKTIEEVFYRTMKNDVAFMLADTYIVLSEHQSTVNLNMPLRDLLYIAEIWKGMVSGDDIYKAKRIRLPRPTFVVLYNGTDPLPPVSRLELSDCFLGEGETLLNLSVIVYNVNEGAGCSLLEKSPTLAQYSRLVALIRRYQAKSPVTHRVMREIVNICLREGILVDLMKEHGKAIIDLLHFELTREEDLEFSRVDGYEQGAADMQARLNKLGLLLRDAGRVDDYFRSMEDPDYQKQLLEEFGL